jgi:hypothetical protein
VSVLDDGVHPLDFETKREEGSASWTRADPEAALIERIAWDTWLVTLPDGAAAHEVTLYRDHGAFVGDCEIREGDRCPARNYADPDEPCAHLCTIYKGTLFNDPTDDGGRITVFDRDDAAIASADHHIEAALTDGGPGVIR